jgi:hypothetical protein
MATMMQADEQNPLVLNAGQDGNCPAPPTTVPQPSPGVNYRKRAELSKRADYNTSTSIVFYTTCSFRSCEDRIALIHRHPLHLSPYLGQRTLSDRQPSESNVSLRVALSTPSTFEP